MKLVDAVMVIGGVAAWFAPGWWGLLGIALVVVACLAQGRALSGR